MAEESPKDLATVAKGGRISQGPGNSGSGNSGPMTYDSPRIWQQWKMAEESTWDQATVEKYRKSLLGIWQELTNGGRILQGQLTNGRRISQTPGNSE